MGPDAQSNQLPLSEQPAVVSGGLDPLPPAVGSNGIDQGCLVPVRLLQYGLLQRHHGVRDVRHVELLKANIADLREAVRLEREIVDSVFFPEGCTVFVAEVRASDD